MVTSKNSKAFVANLNCRNAISKAIKEGYEGKYFNDALIIPVITKCGYVRTGTILANAVLGKNGDAHISKENLEWAEEWDYEISDKLLRKELMLEEHNPIYIDALITKFRNLAEEYYYPLPDSSVNADDVYYFGYTCTDRIYPLGQVKALELFEKDLPVLLLYRDDTEVYAESEEDIKKHCEDGGFCGIEKDVWVNEVLFAETLKQLENSNPEVMLLYGAKDYIGIYQLKEDSEREYRYQDYNRLMKEGLKVDKKNYELVYDMKCEYYPEVSDETILDNLFYSFNIDSVKDFTGHSLSISDVIVLRRGGQTKAYYINNIGFVELPTFYEETEAYIVHFKVEDFNTVMEFSNREDAFAFAQKKKSEFDGHDVLYVSWRHDGEEEIIKTY